MTTMTTTITPDECFAEAAKTLIAGKIDIAREWRQLGEAIANSGRS